LGLAAFHAGLWYWCNWSEGVWTQGPSTDQAHDLTTAWIFYRALLHLDVTALANWWMHASAVHTPFVPFVSAVLMTLFGESRIVAESALPVFTAVWLVATYAIVRILYDTRTAAWATALVSAFPVFLIYSRTYLFEHPFAAMFASAGWALAASDGFARWRPTVVFGFLAGLACLTRGGGPTYFAGPVIVALWSIRHEPDRWRRVGRFVSVFGVAVLVAATWYVPNGSMFAQYVLRATYPQGLATIAAGQSPLSLENARYYVGAIAAQGPGLPMLTVAAVALLNGPPTSRRRAWPSRASVALGAIFVIDFLLLLVATRYEGARYFQPLMAIAAVAIVRCIQTVRADWQRTLFAALTTLLAVHHVVATTVQWGSPTTTLAPHLGKVPLWYQRSHFLALTDFYQVHPVSQDFRLGDTLALLANEGLPRQARVGVLTVSNPFFNPNGLQFEATRRQVDLQFTWMPYLVPGSTSAAAEPSPIPPIDALLLRTGGPVPVDPDRLHHDFPTLFGTGSRFRKINSEMILGDDSLVSMYVADEPGTSKDRK
jgi:hypothetical protein